MKKRLKVGLITLISFVLILTGAFFYYVSDYYQADDVAIEAMKNPGAKVEYSAYLPLLEKIRDKTGITCILVKMPFNMAIFDVNKADEIITRFPEIKNWYIGGHSMGGAMASNYAANYQDKIQGLILLASYIYGDYPDEKTLTIYGTLNTSVSEKVDYEKNIIAIEGGNHAQFGNYGKQKGDAEATISREQQQDMTVEAINEFLMNN